MLIPNFITKGLFSTLKIAGLKQTKKIMFSGNFSTMKHFYTDGFGGIDVLKIKQSEIPIPKKNEVLIKIKATAINRADLLQREGKYPPPQGVTNIIGLEASGYLIKSDGSIDLNKPIMALLSGGSYAQYATVHKDHIINVPSNISIEDAAAIPEAWLTSYLCLKQIGKIEKNQNVLIYAGASGVGTASIQLVKNLFKGNPFCTVSSEEKIKFCQSQGATFSVNYKQHQEKEQIQILTEKTNKKCFQLILDCVGPQNVTISQQLASMDCNWVFYGMLSGAKVQNFNMAPLIGKRINILSTTLRSRNDVYKTQLINNFKKEVLPLFENNTLKPVIHKKININFDNEENAIKGLQEAHNIIASNENLGKVLLVFE